MQTAQNVFIRFVAYTRFGAILAHIETWIDHAPKLFRPSLDAARLFPVSPITQGSLCLDRWGSQRKMYVNI